ncbi:unnamed protein product [Lactuca saligna]|uniref:Uncharacterized protein n=1 Tax=Lactuca saligna TaxID=75948 RepID=A0AA35ZJU7_LACSI|nr:unnamed protein product [Lactuca saligna]
MRNPYLLNVQSSPFLYNFGNVGSSFDLPLVESPLPVSVPPSSLNKHKQFPSSSPSKVSKKEQPLPQVNTSLLQSIHVQYTAKIPLSPPQQVYVSTPLISTLYTTTTFHGESSSLNFQASVLSQLNVMVNLIESL